MVSLQSLKRWGFKTRTHPMNPMVPDLSGGNMSSSDTKSRLDRLDDPTTIHKKMKETKKKKKVDQTDIHI